MISAVFKLLRIMLDFRAIFGGPGKTARRFLFSKPAHRKAGRGLNRFFR